MVVAGVIAFALAGLVGGHSSAAPPQIGGCQILPTDNIWNTRIDHLPVDPMSGAYINTIGPGTGVHPDFGTVWKGAPIGIPYVVVPFAQLLVPVSFQYASQSDPGPYPIPPDPPIEGGSESTGDRHILMVRTGDCRLFELFAAYPQPGAPGGGWHAGSGAIFDLASNALRPDTWTSADAAGLPILPGLVRREEVLAGEINHALRFTCELTREAHIWPARHDASDSTNPNHPPMGQRFRLKASFDITPFSPEVRVILTALKKYGMMLADNGSNWYITGVPNPLWDDDMLVGELGDVHGSDFEAVDVSSLMIDPDSGEAVQPGDLSRDGEVDGVDLAMLLAAWTGAATYAPCPPWSAADMSGDCRINGLDLAMLLAAWD